MELSVVFLGTGPSVPTAMRATACVLIRRGGDRILVDCGEGAQRQMMRSTGLVEVGEIYITHLHADHYLGLPGLLSTWALHDRERPLRIFGPRGTRELVGVLGRIFGRLSYPVEVSELAAGDAIDHDGYAMRAFAVEHRTSALGFALVEEPRPGRFDPGAAARLGVRPGPDFGRLQDGEAVTVAGESVLPEQVLGEPRSGRKVVITGDTAPCEAVRVAAHEAELLVHDASFAAADDERARDTGHSTALQAAGIAADAATGLLCLVHVSARYRVPDLVAEAREKFPRTEGPRDFDLVEIPYPERGEPLFVEGGGRRGDAAAVAGPDPVPDTPAVP